MFVPFTETASIASWITLKFKIPKPGVVALKSSSTMNVGGGMIVVVSPLMQKFAVLFRSYRSSHSVPFQ